MSERALYHALHRARIESRQATSSSELLSQPVLIVGHEHIYDQDGTLRASFRRADYSPSVFKQVLLGAPRFHEILDVRNGLVLIIQERGKEFKALDPDGNEIGKIVVTEGLRSGQTLLADGKTIGSLEDNAWRRYTVRDTQDEKVGRITHVAPSLLRRRPEYSVVEIDAAMPATIRALMIPAAKAMSYINAPAGPGG